MENNQTTPAKSGTTKKVLLGLGGLVLGTLAFFGIKKITKNKNAKKQNENDDTNKEGDFLDTEKPVQTTATALPRTVVPTRGGGDSFPLTIGSKGQRVKTLQQSLIRKYDTGALAKFGADGYFGNELATALRTRGYKIPLQEEDYKAITQETTEPLKSFEPLSVARGLYAAIHAKDYPSALTLLKSIGNTNNYSLVSEQFKDFFINGVRHSLVNAMLKYFDEKSQKETTRQVLAEIGLKYNSQSDKWALSGIKHEQIQSRSQCFVWDSEGKRTGVEAGTILGWVVNATAQTIQFVTVDNKLFFVKPDCVSVLKESNESLAGSPFKYGQWVQTSKPTLLVIGLDKVIIVPAKIPLGCFVSALQGWATISGNQNDTLILRVKQSHIMKSQ
jgi:peptidoglycan hydrolase-like protein with peptidoglycan-binding domain